jgi:hypothetical protein
MLFNTVIDLLHRMTGKTVTAAIRHGTGVHPVTVDTGEHRFMAKVRLDVFFQFGVTGKTVPGTGGQCICEDAKKK